MSDESKAATANGSYWRRSRSVAPLDREHAKRQGEISTLAFVLLGRENALAFLNEEHLELGGRPLAIATESAAGRDLVEAELARVALR